MKNYLIIVICILTMGCMKEDEIILIPYEEPATANYYFTGLIDNTQYDYNTEFGDYLLGYSIDHYNCDTPNTSYSHRISSYILRDNSSRRPQIQVSKGPILFNGTLSETVFNNYFTIGNYTYSNAYGDNGFVIFYTDSNGIRWNTVNGVANQTNSTISIADVTVNDNLKLDVLINFSCTVYDPSGNSMEITNASYLGDFSNFQSH